jgi:nucleotide-binding universal stress UspA family protein
MPGLKKHSSAVADGASDAAVPYAAQLASRAGASLTLADAVEPIPRSCARRFDLLVMGTVARAGRGARLIGNTAEAVLARLPCSMLVLRPDARLVPESRE